MKVGHLFLMSDKTNLLPLFQPDSEEKKKVAEWREIAKKELDDWYKHHDEQLTKTKENNR